MIMSVGVQKKDNENIDMAKDIEQVSSSKYNNEVGEQRKTLDNQGFFSAKRDSNPRPSPWQGDALPLSHSRVYVVLMCFSNTSNNILQNFRFVNTLKSNKLRQKLDKY